MKQQTSFNHFQALFFILSMLFSLDVYAQPAGVLFSGEFITREQIATACPYVVGINSSGIVVGGGETGWSYQNGTFTPNELYPGGVEDNGLIYGISFSAEGGYQASVLVDNQIETFGPQGVSGNVFQSNSLGFVIGHFNQNDGPPFEVPFLGAVGRGYALFENLVPASELPEDFIRFLDLLDINDSGLVVGRYASSSSAAYRGFLFDLVTQELTLLPEAVSVNQLFLTDDGMVYATYLAQNGGFRFDSESGQVTPFPTLPSNQQIYHIIGVNNRGVVAAELSGGETVLIPPSLDTAIRASSLIDPSLNIDWHYLVDISENSPIRLVFEAARDDADNEWGVLVLTENQ